MQYSPKLKMAMEEIKAVLSKHDIAGMIILHTPGFVEYLNKINPSYSILKIKDGEGFAFNAHSKHFGGDKEKRDKAAADTRNMIELFEEFSGKQFMMYNEIAKKVDEKFGKWDHEDGNETSHTQQNN
jgi:hypothetical protein